MEFEKPIYQRIDLLTKLIAVVLVALGIDQLRRADLNGGLLFLVIGGVISLVPFFIAVKGLDERGF
ncbi:MAG: hypothetical protein V3V92_03170 [Candidatus Hydrothermarchaeales archaeon]